MKVGECSEGLCLLMEIRRGDQVDKARRKESGVSGY